jgi:hypothetical protein
MLPAKAIIIPTILLKGVGVLKNNAPVIITKMGVSEFIIPARELSIPCSAIQNKYAGNRLPNVPAKKTKGNFFSGIVLKTLMQVGIRTIPEKTIRIDATWYGLSPLSRPIFIKIKLLPQIKESRPKSNQLTGVLFTG